MNVRLDTSSRGIVSSSSRGVHGGTGWCPRMRGSSRLLLCVVLFVAVLVPAATAAPPRVTSTTRVPLVAAQGDRISVIAKVRGTGKRAVIGLVLGDAAGSATPRARRRAGSRSARGRGSPIAA